MAGVEVGVAGDAVPLEMLFPAILARRAAAFARASARALERSGFGARELASPLDVGLGEPLFERDRFDEGESSSCG